MNINGGELLIILVVALLVLGPGELPAIARALGAAVREFRRASRGLLDELGLAGREGGDSPGGGDGPGGTGADGGEGPEGRSGGRRQ